MEVNKTDYKSWLSGLKKFIHSSRIKAALKVNAELLSLYWHLGNEILSKEKNSKWGQKIIDQLSKDLLDEFPSVKGFSRINLYRVRRWVQFHTQKSSIVSPPVIQLDKQGLTTDKQPVLEEDNNFLFQIPWKHHLEIISKCKDYGEAVFYIIETAKYGWSCNVLIHQIESGLYRRQGKAITNFKDTLSIEQSDLACELIKDPYSFDFLGLSKEHKERELELALMDNVTQFLLELGVGFSFVGRQYPLKVGGKEFAIDLLFYHLRLRCYIVIELKAGEFLPEYTGKLNFYQNVVDDLVKRKEDNPTIGLLICKKRDEIVTEYAIRGFNGPIGVSSYTIDDPGSKYMKACLPSAREIEKRLSEL